MIMTLAASLRPFTHTAECRWLAAIAWNGGPPTGIATGARLQRPRVPHYSTPGLLGLLPATLVAMDV